MGTKPNSLPDGVEFLDRITKDWAPEAGPCPTLEELQSSLDKSFASGKSTKSSSEIFEALPQLTLEALQSLLDEGRASGVSTKSFDEIISEGDRMLKARDRGRE